MSPATVCCRLWLLSQNSGPGGLGTGAGVGAGGCVRSSGGGTGNATGLAELASLLMSSTWMGPAWLFRLIWYFFCPFRPWDKWTDGGHVSTTTSLRPESTHRDEGREWSGVRGAPSPASQTLLASALRCGLLRHPPFPPGPHAWAPGTGPALP